MKEIHRETLPPDIKGALWWLERRFPEISPRWASSNSSSPKRAFNGTDPGPKWSGISMVLDKPWRRPLASTLGKMTTPTKRLQARCVPPSAAKLDRDNMVDFKPSGPSARAAVVVISLQD